MTIVRKDFRKNWSAVSEIPLDHNRVLTIRTTKTESGALVTRASVAVLDGGFLTHAMYNDYSNHLQVSQPPRITCGVVETQHARVMEQLESIKSAVSDFYAAKAASLTV